MASRRLRSDRFFTTDYTPEGMAWIHDATMADVLRRHHPELAGVIPGGVAVFAPWPQGRSSVNTSAATAGSARTARFAATVLLLAKASGPFAKRPAVIRALTAVDIDRKAIKAPADAQIVIPVAYVNRTHCAPLHPDRFTPPALDRRHRFRPAALRHRRPGLPGRTLATGIGAAALARADRRRCSTCPGPLAPRPRPAGWPRPVPARLAPPMSSGGR